MRNAVRNFILCLLLCPLLTGCVDYDLSIRFDSQTHGVITQTIHLSDRLLAFTEGDHIPAFDQLSTRAKALSGKTRRIDEDTLQLTIPFYNGADLVEKFNTFYSSERSNLPGTPDIHAHLALMQRNYFFALKNTLVYDLQIDPAKTLGIDQGLNDISWLNLNFHLETPWEPVGEPADWHLDTDQPQHIEKTFWIPSPIGIGAGVITILCGLGYVLKHRLLTTV